MNRVRGYTILWRDLRQLGFSLTEIMIVIAIIGILSAVAIPNILSYRDNSSLRGGFKSDALNVQKSADCRGKKKL